MHTRHVSLGTAAQCKLKVADQCLAARAHAAPWAITSTCRRQPRLRSSRIRSQGTAAASLSTVRRWEAVHFCGPSDTLTPSMAPSLSRCGSSAPVWCLIYGCWSSWAEKHHLHTCKRSLMQSSNVIFAAPASAPHSMDTATLTWVCSCCAASYAVCPALARQSCKDGRLHSCQARSMLRTRGCRGADRVPARPTQSATL